MAMERHGHEHASIRGDAPGVAPLTIGTALREFGAGDLLNEADLGNRASSQLGPLQPISTTYASGSTAWGIKFPKIVRGNLLARGYIGQFVIPTATTITTGFTVYINTTDDGAFA